MSANDNQQQKRSARTYEEVALTEEVMQRGVDLVAPLSRILLRRSTRTKAFHGRTTDSEWEAFEQEHNLVVPADYKLLCNTVGAGGLWMKNAVVLQSPLLLGRRIKELEQQYSSWQLEGDAHQQVSVWPDQPAFHLEWGSDCGGNALSYFWVCAKSPSPEDGPKSPWPVVQMELEAPLRHNGSIYPCTVTELLYRDVIGKDSLGEYDDDDDDDDDGEDENDFEKIEIDGRCVYQFMREGEPPKTKAKKDPSNDSGTLGEVGSEEDKADFSMLDSLGALEELQNKDIQHECKAMGPLVVPKASS